jgi:hypothetical protein
MDWKCTFGRHDWEHRLQSRPGTDVFRCQTCHRLTTIQGGKAIQRRQPAWVFATVLILFYASIALVLTGHTKLLFGAATMKRQVNIGVLYVRRAERQAVGAPGPFNHSISH